MSRMKLWKTRPEKFVGDYKLLKKPLPQKRHGPVLLDVNVYLDYCRAKLHTTEERLKKKKEENKEERKVMQEKWGEVDEIGQKLKENFVNFNRFMVANMDKRKRAADNLEYNKKLVQEREEGIQELSKIVDSLKGMKEEMEKEVAKHKLYEHYLTEVLDRGEKEEGFRNLDSIVERYEYYTELSIAFAKKQSQVFKTLQNAKHDLDKFEESHQNIVLGLHTQAASLQGRYEDILRRTRYLENLIRRIKDTAYQNYIDIKITTQAVWNLYHHMCKAKKAVPVIPKENVEEQLVFIGKNLHQYGQLVEKMQTILTQQAKRQKKNKS